jgi:serralysin
LTVESFGATKLVEAANQFQLWDASNSGPTVQFQGSPVTEGMFGAWKLIGAEKTASGYEVAFKNGSADQYLVWNTDAKGNYTGNATGVVAGGDASLQLLETSFQQDLNGDGTIGPHILTIESFGATKLVEAANQFQLWDASNSGPTVKFQGSPVTEGEFGAWKLIGAEKTASGYEVAFKNGSADQYIVWNTDAQGSYTGNATGLVGGSDFAFQTLETSFQQDLNGDGTVGVKTTTIEAFGATKLVEAANQFQLWDASNSGPTVQFQGSAVTDGMFGAWKLIGGEKTASGYDVAWKNGSADQYLVWTTDAKGNYTGNATGIVAGADPGLQGLETTFQQDLNGDGHVGIAMTSGTQLLVNYGASFADTTSAPANTAVLIGTNIASDPDLLTKPAT